jgi:hypothetical protein
MISSVTCREGAPNGGKGKSPKMGGLMIEGNLAGDGT